jgi:hypothetical protein
MHTIAGIGQLSQRCDYASPVSINGVVKRNLALKAVECACVLARVNLCVQSVTLKKAILIDKEESSRCRILTQPFKDW